MWYNAAPIYDKNTQQSVKIEGAYLNIMKTIYKKPTANYIQWAKPKSFPTMIRNQIKVYTFTTSILHSIGSFSHNNQTRKGNKRHPNWKGGNKTVIFCRWHDSVHRKSYRLHQKLLNLVSEFGKTSGYKVNIQKSKACLYTNNEISETEIRKKSHLL